MTNTSDLWPAPAKLNLFLHITARREDGYHELQTLFQFIDYSDQLGFELRSDGQIKRLNPLENVPFERDLCVRAAQLLRRSTGCELGADIFLEKNIPMGSGLGGGSSDAATTLLVLNRLWKLQLSKARLAALGAQLGADVPIFVHGHSAWAEGIGEVIEPVDLPESWYVVIFPAVMVPTGQLFGDPELTRDARPIKIRDYFAGGTVNAFEPIVRRKFPAVNQACEWLSNQAVNTAINSLGVPRMTGTGSCVFAAYADETSAKTVAENAKTDCPSDWQIIEARSCSESPLAQKMKTNAGR
jgi:4-diphosphocytidyl-2-C-methyl-D-erythritol kinase